MSQIDDFLNELKGLNSAEDVQKFNDLLTGMSKQIFPIGVRLAYMRIDDLREQDMNPDSMPKAMFDQLVFNMREAGLPEKIPLCGSIEGQKGNWIITLRHEVRAAREAGQSHMLVLYYDSLSADWVRSKQLAHLMIRPVIDPEMVKAIWEQINDVSARFSAYVDPRMFDDIPAAVSFKPVDVDMQNQAKTIMVVFLPSQHSDFEAALKAAMPSSQVDVIYLAHKDTFDQWIEALREVREELDIKAVPTALAEMARLAMVGLEAEVTEA